MQSKGGRGGGLESVICDYDEGSGWGVLSKVAVEGDEMLCTARHFVVAGCWAAGLDLRVGGRYWGHGLEAAVTGARRPNPLFAGVQGVPGAAVAVEGDEMLCTARHCVVAGRWAARLDLRVGGRYWGDGLEAAVTGGGRTNPLFAGVQGVPGAAAERFRVR